MQISVDRGDRINKSWPKEPKLPGELLFPDALAKEDVYRVIGDAANEAERCTSADIAPGKFSNTRQVRIELFRWPKENDAGLLAVLQYDFVGASPSMSCPSIGILAHLEKGATGWKPQDEYLLDTTHHSSLQKIEVADITGDGVDDLVIESNHGGAGMGASSLQVFRLSAGGFHELLNTESRFEYGGQEAYTQVLDVGRTLRSHGQRLCVVKTALIENGKQLIPPRVARPCYPPGSGVDSKEITERNKLLVRLR